MKTSGFNIRNMKSWLYQMEKLTPEKPPGWPVLIVCHRFGWMVHDHPDLFAKTRRGIRKLVKKEFGKDAYMVFIEKPKKLPKMDGDGIPIKYVKQLKKDRKKARKLAEKEDPGIPGDDDNPNTDGEHYDRPKKQQRIITGH